MGFDIVGGDMTRKTLGPIYGKQDPLIKRLNELKAMQEEGYITGLKTDVNHKIMIKLEFLGVFTSSFEYHEMCEIANRVEHVGQLDPFYKKVVEAACNIKVREI